MRAFRNVTECSEQSTHVISLYFKRYYSHLLTQLLSSFYLIYICQPSMSRESLPMNQNDIGKFSIFLHPLTNGHVRDHSECSNHISQCPQCKQLQQIAMAVVL